MRVKIGGREFGGVSARLHRLVQLAQATVHLADVAVVERHLGVDGNGRLDALHRQRQLARIECHQAQGVPGSVIVGVGLHAGAQSGIVDADLARRRLRRQVWGTLWKRGMVTSNMILCVERLLHSPQVGANCTSQRAIIFIVKGGHELYPAIDNPCALEVAIGRRIVADMVAYQFLGQESDHKPLAQCHLEGYIFPGGARPELIPNRKPTSRPEDAAP